MLAMGRSLTDYSNHIDSFSRWDYSNYYCCYSSFYQIGGLFIIINESFLGASGARICPITHSPPWIQG
jgi:hypothetical protein